MSGVDLAGVLAGRTAPDAVAVRAARVVLSVHCRCGRRLATVRATPAGLTALIGGRRYTRAHTADVVLSTALDDLEQLAEAHTADPSPDTAEALAVVAAFLENLTPEMLAGALPPIVFPPSVLRLDALVAAHDAEAARAARLSVRPNQIAHASASCPKCRRVYYLGDQLAEWARSVNDRPRRVIADSPDRNSRITLPGWPATALDRRVSLYRHLNAVLG